MRKKYLFTALFLSIVLLYLHLTALSNFLYWSIWWFDIPVHLLGGLVLGFMLVGIFPMARPVLITLIGGVVLALVWELFEYGIEAAPPSEKLLPDTLGDLFFGILGAVIAGAWALRENRKINEQS
jgi:hypothetical protein